MFNPTAVMILNEKNCLLLLLQFPLLCPYSNATYVLVIMDETGAVVYTDGPHEQHWSGGGAMVTRKIRKPGRLLYNGRYSVNISVRTLVGESFVGFGFGKL